MTAAKKSTKTTQKAEEIFSDAQKTLETGIEKFGKGFEEAAAFGQETMDAMMQSSEIAAKAAEEMNADIAAFSKKSFDETVAAAKDIATAKSPTELFEKQTAFATSAFEGFVAQATKWNEAMVAAAKDSMEPVGKRVNAASDMMKSYTV